MITRARMGVALKEWNADKYGENECPPYCHATTCCSLLIMSLKNYHPVKEIKDFINWIRKDSNSRQFVPADRTAGEQNIMVITTPQEQELENKLIQCGFVCVGNKLKRRLGYPGGNLKMFLLTF